MTRDARQTYAIMDKAHKANKAKLEQLAQDAHAKYLDNTGSDATYWMGFYNGLRRALNVIEGKG